MISQKYRFHGHASLKYVLANGTIARGKVLSIKFVDNTQRHYSRVAMIISKKVLKHAVDRNRARRRLYEIMRQRLAQFNRVVDVAVMIYQPRVLDMSYDELCLEVDKCLNKLGLIDSQDTISSDYGIYDNGSAMSDPFLVVKLQY